MIALYIATFYPTVTETKYPPNLFVETLPFFFTIGAFATFLPFLLAGLIKFRGDRRLQQLTSRLNRLDRHTRLLSR